MHTGMSESFVREFVKAANMAGNSESASSVQEIVNAVINNLNHLLQQENSPQTSAASTSNGNEVSVTSELNRAIQIPRALTSMNVQAILLSTVVSIRAVVSNF